MTLGEQAGHPLGSLTSLLIQELREAVAGRHDSQVSAQQINRVFLPYGHGVLSSFSVLCRRFVCGLRGQQLAKLFGQRPEMHLAPDESRLEK